MVLLLLLLAYVSPLLLPDAVPPVFLLFSLWVAPIGTMFAKEKLGQMLWFAGGDIGISTFGDFGRLFK